MLLRTVMRATGPAVSPDVSRDEAPRIAREHTVRQLPTHNKPGPVSFSIFCRDDQSHPTIVTQLEDRDEELLVATRRGRRTTIIDIRKA